MNLMTSMRSFNLLFACFFLAVHPALNAAENTPVVIEDTNLSGGGFQSDVSISPDGLTVYSSGDVSGISKSVDGGQRFESRNRGLTSPKIASLTITSDNNQILYAATGDKGTSGGLFRSINGGNSWTLTQDGIKAQFAGNHAAKNDPIPNGHPRSNGNLIVVDEGSTPSSHIDDLVIVGTYKDGVKLFSMGGDKAIASVNQSGFVRSMARNAVIPKTVYAAIQFKETSKSGIYKIDYTNPASVVSTLEYVTPRPEGLAVLSSGHVYAAIGTQGLVKFDGATWTLKNAELSTNNPNRQWTAVTGYVANGNDIVYAGANNLGGTQNGAKYSNIWRTIDGGKTWSPLVDANTNVSDTVYGQNYDWWFRTSAFSQAGLGRNNSVVSSIDVARGLNANSVSDDIIYVSGRGGIWKSDTGGQQWAPSVNNMQVTANNGLAVNPNRPSQVVLANTDFVVLTSSDKFESSLTRNKPKGAESRGYDVIFDKVTNDIILGVGDRDTNTPGGGEVYFKSADDLDSTSKRHWTNTNLSAATKPNNGRVRAVTYGYHNGTSKTHRTLLAAVEGEGVYRFHNDVWAKSSGITIGKTKRSNFIWPNNEKSGVVYLLDLSTGLYRSNDGGQHWQNMWPAMHFKNNDFYNTGYLAADDSNPSTLFLSIQGNKLSPIGASFKVFRLLNADTNFFDSAHGPEVVDLSKHSGNIQIKRPGPISIGPNGRLWLTEQQDSKNSIEAALYVMDKPNSDSSFNDLSTHRYRSTTTSPSGIEVSSDGFVYISQNGSGVVKIRLQ